MKKNLILKNLLLLIILAGGFVSCSEDFLNRPPEDSYTVDNFYNTDDELYMAANPLYGVVWFDYQRAFIGIGDVMAGNVLQTDSPFLNFTLTSSNTTVADASNSVWTAVAYSNSVIENVRDKSGSRCTEVAKNAVTGEAMVWKSMAYFYLVRMYHDCPIIHSNSELINNGSYASIPKRPAADIYKYIILTLKKGASLLPKTAAAGRINKYSAYGLLAKVYLTKSGLGMSGTRNQDDLDSAKVYAAKVINESGLKLNDSYADLFTISKGNRNSENLISWHWQISTTWGTQNAMQADLAVQNLTGLGDGWGTWSGPTIDLQTLFNENALSKARNNKDSRRKATMMMYSDYYANWWRDKGGFTCDWVDGSTFASPSGAFAVKHIVGDIADHKAESGVPSEFMKTSLSTHILRLSDIYLVYAESFLAGPTSTTTNAEALKAYNAVRKRAIKDWTDVNSISFMDVFNERRLELAYEGDNWYDFVRLHYYAPTLAIQLLSQQERGSYDGLQGFYKNGDATTLNSKHITPTDDDFIIPYPEVDISINPNLTKAPVPYDFTQVEKEYNSK